MEKLSETAANLLGSEIVKLGNAIRLKVAQGEKIYNYTIGDFDSSIFPIPAAFQQQISEAYKQGYTTYPLAAGETSLKNAVLNYINKELNTNYQPNEILIASGGRPLIYTAYQAIVDAGDKVLYPIPSWNNNHYATITRAQHVLIETSADHNFLPTAADIEPHIEGATLLALCSPLNPTGTVFEKEELQKICDLVVAENERRQPTEKKLYVLFDQMYWALTYGDTQHYHPVELNAAMKPYTIYIDGISKSLAATGVRVGWALAPAFLIEKMQTINTHIGAWAPMAEQHATADFLNNSQVDMFAFLENFKSGLYSSLQMLYKGIKALQVKGFPVDAIAPQAALYLTVKFDLAGYQGLETQQDVTNFLLNEASVAMVPFSSFGAAANSPWYRMSVGTAKIEEIPEMFEKLEKALEGLQKT